MLMGLIDNDEKVASSINQFKTRVHKPEPFYDQNGQDRSIFMTKADEKPYPLGPHTIREYLPPDIRTY